MKKRLKKINKNTETFLTYIKVFLVLVFIIFTTSQIRNVSLTGRLYDFLGSNTIGINPQTQSVNIGNSVSLEVVVKQVNNVYGVQFDLLYDSSILQFSSIQAGSFLGSASNTYWIAPNTGSVGKLDNAALTRIGEIGSKSGDGVIATITFKAKSSGTSTISLSEVIILNPDGNQISVNKAGGSVVVRGVCTDSDGGKDYFKKGSVTLGSQSSTDTCRDRRVLVEYYCGDSGIGSEIHTCPGLCQDGACTIMCTDNDGDGYSIEGGTCGAIDCNDGDGSIHPDAAEVCNNKDDNCDGIKDGMNRACSQNYVGECAIGIQTCTDGTWSGCPQPTTESCNKKDDDCDGLVDEDACPTTTSVEGGEGGRVAAITESQSLNSISSGETGTFDFEKSEDLNVYRVKVTVTEEKPNPQITVKESSAPVGAPLAISTDVGGVYKYISITSNVPDEEISKVNIKFKVPKSWFTDKGLDPSTTKLKKYKAGDWVSLTTRKIGEYSDYYYFEAESTGLTIYVITAEKLIDVVEKPKPEEEKPIAIKAPYCGDGKCDAPSERCSSCPSDCGKCPLKEEPLRGANLLPIIIAVILLFVIVLIVFVFRKQEEELIKALIRHKAHEPGVSEEKTKQLKSYVRYCLSRGYSKEIVRSVLMRKGWSPEMIEKAFE